MQYVGDIRGDAVVAAVSARESEGSRMHPTLFQPSGTDEYCQSNLEWPERGQALTFWCRLDEISRVLVVRNHSFRHVPPPQRIVSWQHRDRHIPDVLVANTSANI